MATGSHRHDVQRPLLRCLHIIAANPGPCAAWPLLEIVPPFLVEST